MDYTAKPRPVDVGELKAELIRNAALVAYESKKVAALSDWLGEDETRRVLYVFDTDTIKAHCAPWLTGPADDSNLGQGYGQILPQLPYSSIPATDRAFALFEERRRAEAVCWLLSQKAISTMLKARLPILQTKAHFEETLRVYERVKNRAKAEPTLSRDTSETRQDRALAQTLKFVSQYASKPEWPIEGNPGQFLSRVLTLMRTRDVQRSSQFVREWDGFVDLVRRRGGIFQLSELRPPDGVLTEKQMSAWSEISAELIAARDGGTKEWLGFSSVFGQVIAPQWYQLNRENLETDIQAVSEVAFANAKLQERNIPLRIVLVTGDRKMNLALASAGDRHLPTKGRVADFSFACVHHLWSFVDVIAADIKTTGKVDRSELFSGFLAFEGEEQDTPSTVERLVRYAIQADQSLVARLATQDTDQAYRRWVEFSDSASGIHRHFLIDNSSTQRIAEVLLIKLQSRGDVWTADKIRSLAVETMERARDRSNVEFSGIGANSILDAHRHGVRNPPDLMFDSLKVTNSIFRDLALPKRVFLSADDFTRSFEKISVDCYRPQGPLDDDFRQECYLKYLVLGALFASANRWVVAEQHAESAIKIVERARAIGDPIKTLASAEPRSHMSGREAYYLHAVAIRIRADGSRSYRESERSLALARRCLTEDRAQGTGLGVPFIRFDNEALALSLSRYYQARSDAPKSACDDLADDVYRSARIVLDRRRDMQEERPDAPTGEKFSNLPAGTKASIATNLLQVGVIASFRQGKKFASIEEPPVDALLLEEELRILMTHTNLTTELARARNQVFVSMPNNDAAIICSPLMMLYAVVTAMMLRDPELWIPRSEDELISLFKSRHSFITVYDPQRFDMLLDFAKTLLRPQT